MAGTSERGYGYRHQVLRRALLPFAYGRACPKCGQLMLPGQQLDLGHTEDRTAYTGMEHAHCNRRAGALKGNAIRRGETKPQPRSITRRW
jgi:hypothetical protein